MDGDRRRQLQDRASAGAIFDRRTQSKIASPRKAAYFRFPRLPQGGVPVFRPHLREQNRKPPPETAVVSPGMKSPTSRGPAAGTTRTSIDLPADMARDVRLLLTLRRSGPQTFKGLVEALLREYLDQHAAQLQRLRHLQDDVQRGSQP